MTVSGQVWNFFLKITIFVVFLVFGVVPLCERLVVSENGRSASCHPRKNSFQIVLSRLRSFQVVQVILGHFRSLQVTLSHFRLLQHWKRVQTDFSVKMTCEVEIIVTLECGPLTVMHKRRVTVRIIVFVGISWKLSFSSFLGCFREKRANF